MAAVVWDRNDSSSLMVSLREGGIWLTPHMLGEGDDAAVVIDRSGVITVTWLGQDDEGSVLFASRWASGQWENPQILAHKGGYANLALNPRGDVAMAWPTEHGVGVAQRRTGNGSWETSAPIRSSFGTDQPEIAIDRRGRGLVLWARSAEEQDFAFKHLAWARTRGNGTWTRARYLDTRKQREVIGDYLDVSMNVRGEVVATWFAEGEDDDLRAARFSFGRGWTRPSRLTGFTFYSTALMTRSGTAIVTMNVRRPLDWAFQQPGGDWTMSGRLFGGAPVDAHGAGQRMAVLYVDGRTVTSRVLHVPSAVGP